jgi:hypothetical protein
MVPPKRNPEEAPSPRRGLFFYVGRPGLARCGNSVGESFLKADSGAHPSQIMRDVRKRMEKAMKGYVHNIERLRDSKTFRTADGEELPARRDEP